MTFRTSDGDCRLVLSGGPDRRGGVALPLPVESVVETPGRSPVRSARRCSASVRKLPAGSLASSYSDQDDWLNSLDLLLDQPVQSWPSAAYPRHFKVLGNHQVARALAIEMADDATLTQQVAEGETP